MRFLVFIFLLFSFAAQAKEEEHPDMIGCDIATRDVLSSGNAKNRSSLLDAHKNDPDCRKVILHLSWNYFDTGNFIEALKWNTKLMELAPENPNYLWGRHYLYIKLEKYKLADEFLLKAKDGYSHVDYFLCSSARNLGDADLILARCKAAVEKGGPGNEIDSNIFLAYGHFLKGQTEKAVPLIIRANDNILNCSDKEGWEYQDIGILNLFTFFSSNLFTLGTLFPLLGFWMIVTGKPVVCSHVIIVIFMLAAVPFLIGTVEALWLALDMFSLSWANDIGKDFSYEFKQFHHSILWQHIIRNPVGYLWPVILSIGTTGLLTYCLIRIYMPFSRQKKDLILVYGLSWQKIDALVPSNEHSVQPHWEKATGFLKNFTFVTLPLSQRKAWLKKINSRAGTSKKIRLSGLVCLAISLLIVVIIATR